VAPILYSWIVVVKGDYDMRLVVMASLVTLWGIRLSYNFARRGGYSWKFWEGDEDYRWKVLQAKPEFKSKLVWSMFNLFFISLYQMGLILLFTLPILKSMNGRPFNLIDIVISCVVLLFIVIETIADQQQWKFYAKKNDLKKSGNLKGTEYEKGFNDKGLWGIMRHPNYAAEQGVWIAFYLFSISATGSWINWSIAGCILLILLFKGSSDFSENISKSKYPDYDDYIKRVPRFIPFIKSS
jgi:steroid 5-alpha reductase family enzyme